ncbi:PAS domain S-box-containing protein [Roseibium hamelinense]|uniref:histidine kinase n=1 Tax=Roseibium hamelinense TaxID=150831 RepID=A0A562STU6_9HYPH|nr:PAS domain S-box protein [Roseibium hamelinense]TWI84632.1 PAS domain S-box-containing protein [Roseibium hamelinense]
MPVARWIKEVAADATFWLVLVFLTASAYAAYVLAVDFSKEARTHDLAAAARAQSELLTATRRYYAREVVEKLYASNDVTVSHDHEGAELTVPAPVTMTLALEKELASIGSPSSIRLVSNYPFPWREDRQLDAFDSEALAAVLENPDRPFERMVETDGGPVFRSARAVVMDQSCVNCHNSHGDSPKTDWGVGDVRGIQQVTIAASAAAGLEHTSLNNLLALLAVAFAAAAGLSLVLSRQRRHAIERVADLARQEQQKNASLKQATARAEAGEAQVAAIIETMLDGLVTIDPSGEIKTANRAALAMFAAGRSEEVIGKPICDFLPETKGLDAPFNCCGQSAEGSALKATGERQEMTARQLNGREYPVEVAISELQTNGLHVHTAILRDLTEEKAAAEKLRQAETRLLDAIESLPDGFVLYDKDDRLVMCNSKYREFYSRSADLIQTGQKFEDIIRRGATRGQYAPSNQVIEDWIEMRMEHHRNPGEPMEQLLDDGRWLRVIESRTSEGGLVGFRVDITELKEREEDLKQSQDLLRNVVDASFDGVIVMDGHGVVVDYSPSAAEVFGWQPDEIIGKHMSSYVIPERYRGMHDNGLKKFLETGEGPVIGKRIEIEGLHKEGHEIIVELAIRHTEGQTGPLFLGYVRDITERKAADDALREAKERAEIANEAKARFLAMMSHEIRTPLNGVLGILSLLRDTNLEPEQKLYVRTARESGRALLELINDILDYTKLEAGRMELDETPCRLHKVLYGIVDLFTPIAREKNLELTLDYPRSVPTNVIADAGRLRQIVLNLVSNALKFTDMGSVQVQVRVESTNKEIATFVISVVDTGIGIPQDKHDMLFGDFVTVDSNYTRKAGGSGLGLAICRQLAGLMKGEITFDSTPGAGSTFRFIVPIRLATAEEMPPATGSAGREDLPLGVRVLLAEDNATNQIVVGHALENVGCDVDIANHGREAVKFAETRDYDCILMDISMPEMDGIEATARIRSNPRNQNTPIIALTAYSLRGDREKFLKSGMDDFLSKPVEKDDLIAMITRHVAPQEGVVATLPPNEAGDPSTSLEAAEEILANMPEEIQEKLLTQFYSDIKTRSDDAAGALDNGNLVALERATHAIKSVAGTFGATELAEIAARVNQLSRDDKHRQAMDSVSELLTASNTTLAQVSTLAAKMGIKLGSTDLN